MENVLKMIETSSLGEIFNVTDFEVVLNDTKTLFSTPVNAYNTPLGYVFIALFVMVCSLLLIYTNVSSVKCLIKESGESLKKKLKKIKKRVC